MRCPTCTRELAGETVCQRCQTDLTEAQAAATAAVQATDRAIDALVRGRLAIATPEANRAVEIHRTPESLQAAALTALATRDFATSLARWRQHRSMLQVDDGRRTGGLTDD